MAVSQSSSLSPARPARAALALLGCVLVCWAAGGIGAVATGPAVGGWYQTIARPAWTPPDGVFGPVWSALYTLMGVSLWLVLRVRPVPSAGVVAFGVQLALNTLWSFLFFGMQAIGAALVEIVLLWLAIAATTALFWRASRLAACLLLPYLAWVSFATALNFAFWRLNP